MGTARCIAVEFLERESMVIGLSNSSNIAENINMSWEIYVKLQISYMHVLQLLSVVCVLCVHFIFLRTIRICK